MTANFPNDFRTVCGGGEGCKDIYYAFFGNVVRGKSAFFRLVVRNNLAYFIRKVFARRKLLPGNFWVFTWLAVAKLSAFPNLSSTLNTLFHVNIRNSNNINKSPKHQSFSEWGSREGRQWWSDISFDVRNQIMPVPLLQSINLSRTWDCQRI